MLVSGLGCHERKLTEYHSSLCEYAGVNKGYDRNLYTGYKHGFGVRSGILSMQALVTWNSVTI